MNHLVVTLASGGITLLVSGRPEGWTLIVLACVLWFDRRRTADED